MSGLEREPSVIGNTPLTLTVIPASLQRKSGARTLKKKAAVVSTAVWTITASVSGMQCGHGSHVG